MDSAGPSMDRRRFEVGATTRAAAQIVWGVGETAGKLAALISQAAEEGDGARRAVRIFEPTGEPFGAFRDLLSRVAEATRIKGENLELEVKVILSCWDHEDADLADLLRTVSKTLDVTLAVERTFTLTVLIPPPTADEAHLLRLFHSFAALEDVVGNLPFLNSVFLYQLPIDVYQGPLEEATNTSDVVELLSREFADPDVREIIHQWVYPVLRLKQRTAGRSAVYSALGAQRLRYQPTELSSHLEARFWHDLLREGLLDLGAASKFVKEHTTELAQECVAACARLLAPCQGARPSSESRLPMLSAVGNPQEMTGPEFDRRLEGAIDVTKAELEPLFAELEAKLRQTFDSVLALEGQNIACARYFLDLIEGHPERDDPDRETAEAAGLFKVAQGFALNPFRKDSIAFVQQASEALVEASRISLTPQDRETDPVSRLDARMEALHASVADEDLRSRNLVQALNATWSRLKKSGALPWHGESEARGLLREVFSEFSARFEKLEQLSEGNQRSLQRNEEQGDELRRVYPWYKRLFQRPEAYRAEKRNLTDLKAELLQDREMARHTVAELEYVLRKATDEVLWPQMSPAIIMDGLRTRLGNLRGELDTFSERLEARCSAAWASVEKTSEVDRLTETGLPNRRKLDLLYEEQLGSRSWGERVREMMAFKPSDKKIASETAPTYADCKNLRDHLHTDPEALLEKMADYAAAEFAPVRSLVAMDIVDMDGTEQARAFLLRILSKTEYLPEFSPGMLPRAQERGAMKRMRVIRCSPQNREILQREFRDLLDENDRFFDTDSDDTIDITTLRSGFPAFVLHVLNNARQQVRDSGVSVERDMWPI